MVQPPPFTIGRLPASSVLAGSVTTDRVVAAIHEAFASSGESLAGANVIVVNLDDAGRCQFKDWDQYNQWPKKDGDEVFPYADMPWLRGKLADGVRFSRGRQAARCVPSRGCNLTGRQPHTSSVHPQGTKLGNIPQQGGLTAEEPFMAGVLASQNPWPVVARATHTAQGLPALQTHQMLHVGKLHASQHVRDPGSGAITETDLGQLVSECGFDEAYKNVLGGQGNPDEPYRGYKEFTAEHITPDGMGGATVTPLVVDPADFLTTWDVDRMEDWLAFTLATDSTQAFVIHWWGHTPHSTLPAIEDSANLHNGTVSYLEQIPFANDLDGKVNPNAPNPGPETLYGAGHDEDGNHVGGDYGPQGSANVLFRRAIALFEAMDTSCQQLEDWLIANHPEAAKRTVWIIHTDNGVHGPNIVPTLDKKYAALGPEYAETIPPTDDGTKTGVPFHDPEDAKGTVFEEGLAVPFVVWSPLLPERVRGADSSALMDATDIYPTILDIISPGWREVMTAEEYAKVDGVSFVEDLYYPGAGKRDYGLYQIFLPAVGIEGELTKIGRAVINRAEWKLIRNLDPAVPVDEWLLFDLTADRTENTDLYADAVAGTNALAAVHLADLQAEYLRLVGNLD